MLKKLFRKISLGVWILQQKFKKRREKRFWSDEWYMESSRTYIWDREFLKQIIAVTKKQKQMLSDISNIIVENEFIVIVTSDGDKHTTSL